ncbi:hypothetical protein [Roseivirga sp. E12]|uniref:hypothetical protein n=1 Tax=Roseivirga sp. E12 TaxID=2819237 RepID=UPI001ABC3D87|nr:hypothetical protein [Roseivirga sp. E12]MBO3698206.1 hypothetical protein [Roseivirga sp. E12]
MKHKILLATNATDGFDNLIEDMLKLLNKTHRKYVSAFSPYNYQSQSLVTIKGGVQSASTQLDDLVDSYEVESILEHKAEEFNLDFEWIKGRIDDQKLSRLSTVFDLLILEQNAFKDSEVHVVDEILASVKCPVMLLPHDWEIENLVVYHDGSMDSVKMVKDFLNLFDPSLRDLPLSVLVSQPSGGYDVEAEKVFIDYLKLFFDNIGVQLIQGDIFDSLTEKVVYNSHKPFLMLGIKDGEISGEKILESPTFLFKG